MCSSRYEQAAQLTAQAETHTLAACIQKNNFNEGKCQNLVRPFGSDLRRMRTENSQVDELYKCCDLFYQRNGDDASTVSCPKASLLRYAGSWSQNQGGRLTKGRLKMKQRAEGTS